jgi:hypothetical protein
MTNDKHPSADVAQIGRRLQPAPTDAMMSRRD